MRVTTLDHGWQFLSSAPDPGFSRPNFPADFWREAVVPGCIHYDLVRTGVIADPFQKEFEAGCQWVAEQDWTFRKTFPWTPSGFSRQVLRFEGLDTICTVHLNGREIARHSNMLERRTP